MTVASKASIVKHNFFALEIKNIAEIDRGDQSIKRFWHTNEAILMQKMHINAFVQTVRSAWFFFAKLRRRKFFINLQLYCTPLVFTFHQPGKYCSMSVLKSKCAIRWWAWAGSKGQGRRSEYTFSWLNYIYSPS